MPTSRTEIDEYTTRLLETGKKSIRKHTQTVFAVQSFQECRELQWEARSSRRETNLRNERGGQRQWWPGVESAGSIAAGTLQDTHDRLQNQDGNSNRDADIRPILQEQAHKGLTRSNPEATQAEAMFCKCRQ